MVDTSAIPTSIQSGDSALEEFRRSFLFFLSIFCFFGAFLLIIWSLNLSPELRSDQLGAIGAMLCVSVVVFVLAQARSAFAPFAFCAGALLTAALLFATFRQQVLLALFPLVVLLSGILLGRAFSVAMAVLASAFVLLLHTLVGPVQSPSFWRVRPRFRGG